MHCHVVLPVLLVADSAYRNAVGGRCIGGGLLRFIELHVIHTAYRAHFVKYLVTFLLFHLRREWVVKSEFSKSHHMCHQKSTCTSRR